MTINEHGKNGPMIYNRGHFIYYFPHDISVYTTREGTLLYMQQQKAQKKDLQIKSGSLCEAFVSSLRKYMAIN